MSSCEVENGDLGTAQNGGAGSGQIGVLGALSIGVGGIVGGGFFATFGLAVVGSRGSTYISFLLGGVLALLTAYSYVRLTLRYPGPAGTAGFVRRAFGRSLLPASVNVLLIYSYIAIMAVYAHALAAYAASYLPADHQTAWLHLLSSAGILLLGYINFAGAALMAKFESLFNIGKLAILAVFIGAGFLLGSPDWSRLGAENFVPTTQIVSSGMIVFLAYEGFELISNASARISNPEKTLPIAFYGSVASAIVIYVLAIVVAIGHMPFDAMKEAQNFALSATAQQFMGSFGFALMTLGAVLASASAINADFFGASKLPVMLSEHGEMPSRFSREINGKHVVSMVFVGAIALLCVNFVGLSELSAATSGGFLIVYAVVNFANAKLAHETRSHEWVPILAGLFCIVALGVTIYDFTRSAATMSSALAILAIALLAIASEFAFCAFWPDRGAPDANQPGAAPAPAGEATAFAWKGPAIAAAVLAVVAIGALPLVRNALSEKGGAPTPVNDQARQPVDVAPATSPVAENAPARVVAPEPQKASPAETAPAAPAAIQKAGEARAAGAASKPRKKRKK